MSIPSLACRKAIPKLVKQCPRQWPSNYQRRQVRELENPIERASHSGEMTFRPAVSYQASHQLRKAIPERYGPATYHEDFIVRRYQERTRGCLASVEGTV